MTRDAAATVDGFRDAIAWTEATINGDTAAVNAIAGGCDIVAMLDAITAMYVGLLAGTYPDPLAVLAILRTRLAATGGQP